MVCGAESLEGLIEWLHSNGEREHALKARLQAVHAAMLTRNGANPPAPGATRRAGGSLVHTAASKGNTESATPPVDTDVENDAENVGGNANVGETAVEAVSSALEPVPVRAPCPEPKEKFTGVVHASAGSPQKLGEFLLSLEQSIARCATRDECFLPAWGEVRRSKWRSFVAAATGLAQPQAEQVAPFMQPHDVEQGPHAAPGNQVLTMLLPLPMSFFVCSFTQSCILQENSCLRRHVVSSLYSFSVYNGSINLCMCPVTACTCSWLSLLCCAVRGCPPQAWDVPGHSICVKGSRYRHGK